MKIFLILVSILAISFFVGLLMILLCSSDEANSFSILEITKNGFYSIVSFVLIITFIILSLT